MGMMIGGFNTNCSRVVTLKRADGTVAGRITKTGGNSGKKLKKLQYNFKQVSARILQAKTSGNAGQTVIMARSKLALLRQKVKGGEYDDEELAAAIIHAEKMVRIAKKKQKHLKAEENAEKGAAGAGDPMQALQDEEEPFSMEDLFSEDSAPGMSKEELQQRMARLEKLMEEALREAEQAEGPDDLAEELLATEDETDPADLALRRKKHRADELKEITEADMKYLKALFDKYQREKQGASGSAKSSYAGNMSGSAGVSLEIGGMEMPVADPEPAAPAEGGNLDVTV